MSEKKLRKAIEEYLGAPSAEGCMHAEGDIVRALDDDPDVVGIVLDLKRTHDNCVSGHDRALFLSLADRFSRKYHIRLTDEPPGWEYTDE